jgi:transcriptional regulator with XRE-family HTH domain
MNPTMIKTPAQLGALIKARRTELNIDQVTLAEKARVSRNWLMEIEKGVPGASVGVVLRVLAVLKVSLVSQPADTPERVSLRINAADRPVDINQVLEKLKSRNR